MIKLNNIEYLTTQYIGIGVLNVKVGDRGELRAHSTDWILKHNDNVLVVSDAMYQEFVKGEGHAALTEDALDSAELEEPVDLPPPSLDQIREWLIELGYAVGLEDNGTLIAKPEPPIEVIEHPEPAVVTGENNIKKNETNDEMMARLMGPTPPKA